MKTYKNFNELFNSANSSVFVSNTTNNMGACIEVVSEKVDPTLCYVWSNGTTIKDSGGGTLYELIHWGDCADDADRRVAQRVIRDYFSELNDALYPDDVDKIEARIHSNIPQHHLSASISLDVRDNEVWYSTIDLTEEQVAELARRLDDSLNNK